MAIPCNEAAPPTMPAFIRLAVERWILKRDPTRIALDWITNPDHIQKTCFLAHCGSGSKAAPLLPEVPQDL